MKSGKWLILVTSLLLALFGCSNNKSAVTKGNVSYPEWWNTQPEKDYICTYGMATKTMQTMSVDAARSNAMAEAARYVRTEVNAMLKNYEEEVGVNNPQVLALTQNVVENISHAEFGGVITGSIQTYKETTGKGKTTLYTTYIQLKIPKDEVNRKLVENIKNEEALYNQFKASQAFQELERKTGK